MPDGVGTDIKKVFDDLSPFAAHVCKGIVEGKQDVDLATNGHKVSQVQSAVRKTVDDLGLTSGQYMTDRHNLGDLYGSYLKSGGGKSRAGNGATQGNSHGGNGAAEQDATDAAAAAKPDEETTSMATQVERLKKKLLEGPKRHREVARIVAKGGGTKEVKKARGLADENTAGIYIAGLWHYLGLNKVEDEKRLPVLKQAVKLLPDEESVPAKPRGKAAAKKGVAKPKKKVKAAKKKTARAGGRRKKVVGDDLGDLKERISKYAHELGGGEMAGALTYVANDLLPELAELRKKAEAEKAALDEAEEDLNGALEALSRARET